MKNDQSDNTNTQENATIDADLEQAVEMSMASDKETADAIPAQDEPTKVETPEAASAPDATKKETPPDGDAFSADDALTERAVRAGLSLADVKGFRTKEALEGILTRLEKPTEATKNAGKEDGEGNPADDFPELTEYNEETNPDGYDPKIVKAFNSMRTMLKGAFEKIDSLTKAGEAAKGRTYFEQQFGKLDEGVRDHVDAVAKTKLKAKFDMLEAGYKATKAGVPRDEVFKEATALVFGDKLGEWSASSREARLAQRKQIALARPSGESGRRPKETQEDVERDIASYLEKQFPETN